MKSQVRLLGSKLSVVCRLLILLTPLSAMATQAREIPVLTGESYTLSVPGTPPNLQWADSNQWIDHSSGLLLVPIETHKEADTISVRSADSSAGSVHLHVRRFITIDRLPASGSNNQNEDETAAERSSLSESGVIAHAEANGQSYVIKNNEYSLSLDVSVGAATSRESRVVPGGEALAVDLRDAPKLAISDDDSVFISRIQADSLDIYRSRDHGATFALVDRSRVSLQAVNGELKRCGKNQICASYRAPAWTARVLTP